MDKTTPPTFAPGQRSVLQGAGGGGVGDDQRVTYIDDSGSYGRGSTEHLLRQVLAELREIKTLLRNVNHD